MNTVTLNPKPAKNLSVKTGAIFEDPSDGELFILVKPTADDFVCVSLKDGGRWRECSVNIMEAFSGLRHVSNNARVEVTP